MYKIISDEVYKKKLLKFLKKHPDLKDRYFKTIKILEENPYHPSLRLHRLKGDMKDFFSVSINMKYRIILDIIIIDNLILLLDIGNHDEVY
jgi:mRNA-degrading endonuclease YafQ of YafQ-DinJ toxin-antitoxin module